MFPAGPQPRPSEPSVPCRTDLNHDHLSPVFPAGRTSTTQPPDRMSERLSEDMSGSMSERMPGDLPARMSEDMSERMSDRMPGDMPERMSEEMSEICQK